MAKLKGNTLIETLVAMVVIIFCSTLATVIYLNTLASQNTAQKLKAFYMAQETIRHAATKKDYLDATLGVQGLSIEKTCKPYKGEELISISVVIRNEEGKKLWEQSQVLSNE